MFLRVYAAVLACLLFVGLVKAADQLKLNEETLLVHNKYRMLHGSNALVLNENLIALAQKAAESYALTGVANSVVYHGATLGRNIAIFKGYVTVTGHTISNLWYETGKHFNYNVNDFQNAGSFTQLVWRGSTDFGLGEYQVGSTVYVVALYYPPGNIVGHVHQNVLPMVQDI